MTRFKKYLAAALGLAAVLPGKALAITPDTVIITSNTYPTISNLKPSNYVAGAINLLLGVAGIISFIFLLWGGIQWILAGGDKEGTEKARKRITNALIGLAVVFSAYALIFILQALFNIDIIRLNLQPL